MKNLLQLNEDKEILFCDKPLPLCEKKEIKSLSIEEINNLMSKHRSNKFQWSSNIFVPDEWQLTQKDQSKIDELKKRMIPSNKFVICFVNKSVGYCVFTNDKIQKGDVIIYSGNVTPREDKKLVYGVDTDRDKLAVDAKNIGGHGSLFLDLFPPEIDLPDFPFEVSRNNFVFQYLNLSCGNIVYLEAVVDIKPKSQCGVRYGEKYWKLFHFDDNHVQKIYFSTDGKIIEDFFADFLRLKTLTPSQAQTLRDKSTPVITSSQSLEQYVPLNQPKKDDMSKIISILDMQEKSKSSPEVGHKNSFGFMKGAFGKATDSYLLKKYQRQDKDLPSPELALRRAAADGSVNDVKLLIEKYPKLNINEAAPNSKMTALAWAIKKGYSEVAMILIENGAKSSQDVKQHILTMG